MHKALEVTNMLTIEARAQWIVYNSRQDLKHTARDYFTEEELAVKHQRSTELTSEIIELADVKKKLMDSLTKGSENEYEATIPSTLGIKKLTSQRDELVRIVKKGFEEHDIEIYGIPHEDGFMYFFDVEGNVYEERTKKLSIKERRAFFGMFASDEDDEIMRKAQ